jgi:uncharacterized protein YggL (DUF469 family)
VGEFVEYGFEVFLQFREESPAHGTDRFWDEFIAEIERNELMFGGGAEGFVSACGRASATEEHRAHLHSWLTARPEVASVRVGPLVDAWHVPRNAL